MKAKLKILPLILTLFLSVGCSTAGPQGETGNGVLNIEKTSTTGNVDTYTITYTNGEKTTFIVTNGTNGEQGIQGLPGEDGHTPVITIGSNGNWYIDGVDTGIHAQGEKGDKGDKGDTGSQGDKGETGNGILSIEKTGTTGNKDIYTITYTNGEKTTFEVTNGTNGEQGIQGLPGEDGHTPVITIGSNGNWYVDGEDTGIHAQGDKGDKGDTGSKGDTGPKGDTGEAGVGIKSIAFDRTEGNVDYYKVTLTDGTTYYFTVTNGEDGTNGINGLPGADGHTPVITIGSNGNWYVDGVDSGKQAIGPQGPIGPQGEKGDKGDKGDTGAQGETGLSAYEIYLKYYPEYTGTEKDWIDDLALGVLGDKYTITWANYDGTILEVDENVSRRSLVEYNGNIPEKNSDADFYYNFSGWSPAIEPATCDITYIAQYSSEAMHTYTVTWKNYDGTILEQDLNVPYGSMPSFNDLTPTKESNSQYSYSFIGWDSEIKKVTGDITYTALFEEIELADWQIELDSTNSSARIVSYNGTESNVVIPSLYKDKPIVSIGSNAFENNTYLKSVEIPSSVTSIGSNAFSGCMFLTSIAIPNNVTSIGNDAFSECYSLIIYCEASSKLSGWNSSWNSSRPVYWEINEDNYSVQNGIIYVIVDGNAIVTGHTNELSNNVVIPETITINGTTYSVTSIGGYAFSDCSSLTSIIIPNSVTSIGDSAFFYCLSLTSIVIPNSVTSIGGYAFEYCSSLTTITIPNSVTSIGSGAFYNCSSLTSITIPSIVTSIGGYAFYNCSSLTIYCEASSKPSEWNSSWNNSNRPVYWGINENNYSVQNGIIYVIENGNAIVTGHTNELSNNVVIPETITINGTTYSVTSIGEWAFFGCSSLTSVTFEEGSKLTSVDSYSFKDCSSLTSIVIPNSVTSIGSNAFSGCSSLTSIVIPNNVTSIGNNAFSECYSLIIYCGANNKPSEWTSSWNNSSRPVYWGINENNYSVQNGIIYVIENGNAIVTGHTNELSNNVVIPETITINGTTYSVTSIGEWAFFGCSSLTSIIIPNSITSIGERAFQDCSSLTSVTFEEGSKLTSIGSYSFCGCSSLTSIAIPNSVTSIGEGAFCGCSSLTSIVIPNSVTSIRYAFYGCSSLTIYCESSSQLSGWDSNWNYDDRPVYWAGSWSYVNGVPTPNQQ